MPCVDIREAICKFPDDIVCFSTYCITRTVISQRHAQTSSPFFDGEKRSVHVFVSCQRGIHAKGVCVYLYRRDKIRM